MPVVAGILGLFKDANDYVRRPVAVALGQLGMANDPVLDALLALLKDKTPGVRQSAAEALGKLGQKRPDWTDKRLLEMLQDNLSGWRKTAGMVLANRTNLTQATYDQVMALRLDSRPWVRLAAWDALLAIEQAREARERDVKNAELSAQTK